MAIYHLHASVVHRSLGHSAVAASAYASGKDLYNDRMEKMETYGRKRGVFHTEIIAPENAPSWVYDRQQLWNRAEQAEKRIDAQPARVFVLALPHEFTDNQKIELVNDYVREVLVAEGMVVDIGMHRADRKGDLRNDHVHLVMTMRELDGDKFSSTKNREWNKKETLVHWREQWAAYQNRALEEAGLDERVDHRTLEAQGIDREPTKHLGVEASAIKRRGDYSELAHINQDIADTNSHIDELVRELSAIDAQIAEELASTFLPEMVEEVELSEVSEELDNAFLPAAKEETEPLEVSWEEVKREAQNPFNSATTQKFESDIMKHGKMTEWGLGRNWYDNTLAMFENLYHSTFEVVKDIWQKYVTDRYYNTDRFKDIDSDMDQGYEPER